MSDTTSMKINTILSGQYELIRILGSGTTSTVYLARHISLKRECAIKIYPKIHNASLSLLAEAQLLISFHHPLIPQIYDIAEDDENCYLVEEFIPGEPLEVFLSHQTTISQNIFFTFCSQICEIFQYLHSRPVPILYQDLKPEHLIVHQGTLKLVDFGDSHRLTLSGNVLRQGGNLDFSAPECISGGCASASSDIYSIGKLIQYLSGYLDVPISSSLHQIIHKSTLPDPALRYPTVQALALALQSIQQKKQTPHLIQSIAVVGAARGCGATHISIALTSAINALGHSCCYYERNASPCLSRLARQDGHVSEQEDGSLSYRHFKGFPQYGPGIQIHRPQGISVEDYGTVIEPHSLNETDLILLICPDAPWLWDDAIDKANLLEPYGNRLCFLCNFGKHCTAGFYARQFGKPVFRYFYDIDPFRADKDKLRFASQLLSLPEKGRLAAFWDSLKTKRR